jgi:hypothetical protein
MVYRLWVSIDILRSGFPGRRFEDKEERVDVFRRRGDQIFHGLILAPIN